MNSTRPFPVGLIARTAIQCPCADTGKIGSFLYSGETWRNPGSRVSPVFRSLGELFEWCKVNHWQAIGDAHTYQPNA